jgi:hypothetical protein
MSRRHRDQTFRKNDVVRALRAAQAAGIENPRIEIDTITRVIRIVPGDLPSNDAAAKAADNPWDTVLQHEH